MAFAMIHARRRGNNYYFRIEARHTQDIFYKGYDLLVKVTFTSAIAYCNRISHHQTIETEMARTEYEAR